MRIVRCLFLVPMIWAGCYVPRVYADAPSAAALTGTVSSTEEGPMEGVLVSAKKAGSTISVTVVSDAQGRYRFPASKLDAGEYALRIRAVGYDLDGPKSVMIASQKTATADIKLKKTSNLVSQLSNSEFLTSFPGADEQRTAARYCAHCHTLERVVRSTHDAAEFEQVVDRMFHYTPESFPLLIQPPNNPGRTGGGELTDDQRQQQQENRRKLAAYLSTVNLSANSEWNYSFKMFSRPKGRATHVIMTEYDLPKQTRTPHDVIVDSQGVAWYASFGEPILGKVDPKTGKVTEYPVPVLKPGHIIGTLDIEFDKDENIWLAMTFQGGVAKFDRKTEKFQVFSLPPDLNGDYRELTFASPAHSYVDGKVWINDSGSYTLFRLDIATGKFEVFEPFPKPRPTTYEVTSDSQNNGWFTVLARENLGRIDAKTGKIAIYKTPTPRSGPRRGSIDSKDRFWFAENRANKIGVFDPKSEKFQEWEAPTPEYNPYDVVVDKNEEAWAGTEFADSVLRVNTKSGETTEYLLPRHTNMRRSFVDNSTTPVTFWVGNTHGASIVKVEPLD